MPQIGTKIKKNTQSEVHLKTQNNQKSRYSEKRDDFFVIRKQGEQRAIKEGPMTSSRRARNYGNVG